MAGTIKVAINAIDNEQTAGWLARLYATGKGYKATLMPGKTAHHYVVKRNGEHLNINQANSSVNEIDVSLSSPTIVAMLRDLECAGLMTLTDDAKAELATHPTLYRFGDAPKAREDGFALFVTLTQGTESEVNERYLGKGYALVVGAAVYGAPGHHEYGVFAR
ncbi:MULTISPECIES: hypothetical protein [Pseudomonas]|uniref:Uncharacterized protein n=1 Tax=Pseudomonas fluorescens TaxID=294 RepID=A0A166QKP3_PSEFL|nr:MULTISPECIES: hypothetical protein [Pseudomonas]KZN20434.1 hypothetical protein A1D17_02525 [Pseudomonas fluorescens]